MKAKRVNNCVPNEKQQIIKLRIADTRIFNLLHILLHYRNKKYTRYGTGKIFTTNQV